MNVLFLCTGNSCRSIIAEALFNHMAPQGMRAMSAGSNPTGEVHPRSLALLERKGIPITGYYSKSWDEISLKPDLVVTVCNNAAGETCPAFLGNVERIHWDIEDPVKVTGADEEIDAAFEAVFLLLHKHIIDFLADNCRPEIESDSQG